MKKDIHNKEEIHTTIYHLEEENAGLKGNHD